MRVLVWTDSGDHMPINDTKGTGMRAFAGTLAAATLLGGCATTPQTDPSAVYDPLEPLNRGVFAFNEAADKAVIGPVADLYVAITPGFARQGVRNVLSNLNSPVVVVNNVLQGDPGDAVDTTYRFVINTTIGILGLWDAAAHFGLEGRSEDFGQTLAVWGVGEGPYLVLPLMGPSNLRDLTGRGVDNVFDPLNWTEFESDDDLDDTIQISRAVLGALDTRVQIDDQLQQLREQPEPYVALRRAYTAQRQAAVRNGEEEADPYKDLPDFDDFE